ncbi:hypothetical protein JAAARDRAFT_192884 [Jaapia argillacea MUCL 33604]|uniref:C3HC-type domain-containing protein n=1 Tax=Jaapia argillacea MUCL 33604 TaxID=933084 RepID=A0A067PXB0_9AGAM|nr:hypothetical protein JAAARDRAFT_192884 [Jaapia argillacea MUCL 33604]
MSVTATQATADTMVNEDAAGLLSSPSNNSMKRKLDDAIQTLDEAVAPIPDPTLEPPQAKRARTARSLYSTLAKYGIKTKAPKSSSEPGAKSETLAKTPHLAAILARTAARTRKAIPFKLPNLSHANIVSSPSYGDYRPSSTQSFMLRLGTFKLPTYSSKPSAIDAVAVAKCGWMNDGKERLVCGMCNASWVVAGREGMSRDAANALVEKQRASLVDNHKDGCPWKTRQCDDSIYRIPLQTPALMAREIKTRAVRLTRLLQGVQIRHPLTSSQLQSLRSVISSILPPFPPIADSESSSTPEPETHQPPAAEIEPSETAILTSFFGWDVAPPAPPPPPAARRTSSSISTSVSRASSVAPTAPTHSRAPSVSSVRSRDSTPTPGPSTLTISAPKRLGSHNRSRTSSEHPLSEHGITRGEGHTAKRDSTLLHCSLCQRRVGLWAFAPPTPSMPAHASGSDATTDSAAASKTTARSERQQRPFDLLLEHRNYCPYVVKSSIVPSLPVPSSSSTTSLSSTTNTTSNLAIMAQFASGGSGQGPGPVEGWRAILQVVARYDMGRRRVGRRTASSGAVRGEVTDGSGGGGGDELEMEVDGVEAMVAGVKSRGGKELLKYVKGLLG